MPTPRSILVVPALLALGACAQSAIPSSTGDGGARLTCGTGTRLDGAECVVVDAGTSVRCGAGTVLDGSVCIVADAGVPVDAGTSIRCGAGTVLDGSVCVAAGTGALSCGPGTTLMDDTCVALGLAYYDVRVPVSSIPGDGYSRIPVVVVGRNADGTPATDEVVLLTTRAGAGAFQPQYLTLGATPSTSWFTPCLTSSSLACVGTFRIAVALASNPSVVLAETGDLAIVRPEGVGSPAPCLLGGDALYFAGESGSYIYSGTKLISAGTFTIAADGSGGSPPSFVHVAISPSTAQDGAWWDTYFSTVELGQPMTTTVYEGAERWPFQSSGKPGFDISGDGRGCNQEFGRFEVHTLTIDANGVAEFLATFEQHCESPTAPALRGCVRYVR